MIFELVAANIVIFIAAVLQAATGVGFAMVAVPLLALINLAWVPAPMLICNIGLSITIMNRGRDALERAEAPPLILGLALGTFAGAAVLSLVEGRGLGLMIGGIIVGLIESVGPQFMTATWTEAIVYGLFLVVLFVKPSGLFGMKYDW